jgi:hypothetical protein
MACAASAASPPNGRLAPSRYRVERAPRLFCPCFGWRDALRCVRCCLRTIAQNEAGKPDKHKPQNYQQEQRHNGFHRLVLSNCMFKLSKGRQNFGLRALNSAVGSRAMSASAGSLQAANPRRRRAISNLSPSVSMSGLSFISPGSSVFIDLVIYSRCQWTGGESNPMRSGG